MKRLLTFLAPTVAIFWVAARRLWSNRRLAAGLLAGFAVAVAAASSVPVFAAGALQRVLQVELSAANQPMPVGVTISHVDQEKRPTTAAQYAAADRVAVTVGANLLSVKGAQIGRFAALDVANNAPVNPAQVDGARGRWMAPAFVAGLEQHVLIVDGRLPKAGKQGDSYEAMVLEGNLETMDYRVGAEFFSPISRDSNAPRVRIHVVGAFRRADPLSPYWFVNGDYEQMLFVPEPSFQEILRLPGVKPYRYAWFFGIPSDAIKMTDAPRLLGAMAELEARVAQELPDTEILNGPKELLGKYVGGAADLQLMLLWLAVPTLAILAYFLVVTSGLMVDGQRQEIAVLRSRGASLWQIAGLYALEGVLLAGSALLVGYPLGIGLAKAMGAAAGFLQFVNRKPVPLLLPSAFWGYGLAAALLAVLAYLAPAVLAARQSITTYKQESARGMGRPLWSKLGLDVLCLGLAGYGYYSLQKSHAALLALQAEAGAKGQPVAAGKLIEPLHILGPVLLVLGGGLLLMRLLPLLIGLVARLTNRLAAAPLYLTLVQLSRSPRHYTPVVLLLTLTVGMGLYSAATARTLERNTADRLLYARGADIVLDEIWDSEKGTVERGPTGTAGGGAPSAPEAPDVLVPPPFLQHQTLPGVVHAARVRTQEIYSQVAGKAGGKAMLMAIDPPDFGQVAWFRRDLLPHHLNEYLNLLALRPEGVIVSTAYLQKFRLTLGDRIQLSTGNGRDGYFYVLAAVDYWPTIYAQKGDFFVANLETVEDRLGLARWNVWLKMQDGAKLEPVYQTLKDRQILLMSAQDSRQALIQARRDPQLNGLLGGLSSGFLLAAGVTVLGFLLYATLSARSRVLQFGVLRAMGLSVPQLLTAVALEQVFAVGLGMAAGTGLGLTAARLFVPFLQQGADVASRTPPFVVVNSAGDRLRLYVVLVLMLLLGLAGLMTALSRLRVAEAVKLGEDH